MMHTPTTEIYTLSLHDALPILIEPVRSSPTPEGSSTNMKGTRNAGMVYFHDCRVVLYGSPPVIAAAAKGESAVGGETSDRKSTRLNSSHITISYAVFCLKKKNT